MTSRKVPCHASHYNLAGRVFKTGPAPANLVVPAYHFASENRLVLGASA
jgi:ubiquinol-cytochrome c reductase iron-sulfur subunit